MSQIDQGDEGAIGMILEAIEKSFLIDPTAKDFEPSLNINVVIGGWSDFATLEEIAAAYKKSADDIVDKAYESLEFAYEYTFPVIFLYRHAIEVGLKSIHPNFKSNHSLDSLRDNLINKLRRNLSDQLLKKVQDRINDFKIIDQKSTRFRFGVDEPEEEFILDLTHLKKVTNELFEIIDKVKKFKGNQEIQEGL